VNNFEGHSKLLKMENISCRRYMTSY